MPINTPTQQDTIQQTVYLHPCDIKIIEMVAQQRGLETNGFDTAVKLIIHEWLEVQEDMPCITFPLFRSETANIIRDD